MEVGDERNESRICRRCGQLIPPEARSCPRCKARFTHFLFNPEATLLLTIAALIFFFIVTGFFAKFYHARQSRLAKDWFNRGSAALSQDQADDAIADLRNALFYSRDNTTYTLRLAEALIAAHRSEEARAYLLTLWDHQPGSGIINLTLARMDAQEKNVEGATRYYHNAIYGVWESNPDQQRWEARLELCRLLISSGDNSMAQVELIALALHLPKNSSLHFPVGSMFLQIKDYQRALEEFRLALEAGPHQGDALADAGEAAFQLGDFQTAENYFSQATRQHVFVDADEMDTARLEATLNPYDHRFPLRDRLRRALAAYDRMLDRLTQCEASYAGSSPQQPVPSDLGQILATTTKVRPKMSMKNLLQHPEQLGSVMDLVFQMQSVSVNYCGTTPLEKAIAMIHRAQNHPGAP